MTKVVTLQKIKPLVVLHNTLDICLNLCWQNTHQWKFSLSCAVFENDGFIGGF